jgi:hypothetical protein
VECEELSSMEMPDNLVSSHVTENMEEKLC